MPPLEDPLVFQVRDPEGRLIGLRKQTWEEHIQPEHPGVQVEWIQAVLENPRVIVRNDVHGSLNYYVNVGLKRFRLVAVKPSRGDPPFLVATAYPCSIPPQGQGRVIWTRK